MNIVRRFKLVNRAISAAVLLRSILGRFWFYPPMRRAVTPYNEKKNIPAPHAIARSEVPPTVAADNKAVRELGTAELASAVLLARKYYDPKTDHATRIRAHVELTFGDVLGFLLTS